MTDKKFIDGLIIKKPRVGAPDYVISDGSIKREEMIKWLQGETDEWINFQIKNSKQGKYYAEVNTWKPENKDEDKNFPF